MLRCFLWLTANVALHGNKHPNIVTNVATNISTKQSPNSVKFGFCFLRCFLRRLLRCYDVCYHAKQNLQSVKAPRLVAKFYEISPWRYPPQITPYRENPTGHNPPPPPWSVATFLKRKFENWHYNLYYWPYPIHEARSWPYSADKAGSWP